MSKTTTATHETETELIERAQSAVSECNWTVGECAGQWTKRFARGRTDGDFGELVGMSGDQVYQRRRVWETFADVRENYAILKWSHFYIALNWDDASECLSWANDNEATIAEMKAWRRLQHGEDMTQRSGDEDSQFWGNDGASTFAGYGSDGEAIIRKEGDLELPATRAPMTTEAEGKRSKRGVPATEAASLSQGEYTPFRTGAVKPPKEMLDDVPGSMESVNVEQTVKRLATMLERCAKAVSPIVQKQFGELPEKVRTRFLAAMMDLRERTASLK